MIVEIYPDSPIILKIIIANGIKYFKFKGDFFSVLTQQLKIPLNNPLYSQNLTNRFILNLLGILTILAIFFYYGNIAIDNSNFGFYIMSLDIRWQQRFSNFQKAFENLQDAVNLQESRPLTPLEQQGLMHSFVIIYELSWNMLKDYLKYQGIMDIMGAKDSFRQAFKLGIIANGDVWMQMIGARNMATNVYDESMAQELAENIYQIFYPEFALLSTKFTGFLNNNE